MNEHQLFRPGDLVGCIWDDGAFTLRASESSNKIFPLMLIIPERGLSTGSPIGARIILLTAEGKIDPKDAYPCIWYWATGGPPIVGIRPKWIPKKTTWCWVWNDDDPNSKCKSFVLDYKDGKYIGTSSLLYDYIYTKWDNAEPCIEK